MKDYKIILLFRRKILSADQLNAFTVRSSYPSADLGIVFLPLCPSVQLSVYHMHA